MTMRRGRALCLRMLYACEREGCFPPGTSTSFMTASTRSTDVNALSCGPSNSSQGRSLDEYLVSTQGVTSPNDYPTPLLTPSFRNLIHTSFTAMHMQRARSVCHRWYLTHKVSVTASVVCAVRDCAMSDCSVCVCLAALESSVRINGRMGDDECELTVPNCHICNERIWQGTVDNGPPLALAQRVSGIRRWTLESALAVTPDPECYLVHYCMDKPCLRQSSIDNGTFR